MTDTRAATDAPRYAPNCKHAYMNDGFDCPFCLRDRLATSETRVKELERESEWRGLLLIAPRKGWSLWPPIQGHDVWSLFKSKVASFELPPGPDGLPVRPPDDVVAKIKEAVNG